MVKCIGTTAAIIKVSGKMEFRMAKVHFLLIKANCSSLAKG